MTDIELLPLPEADGFMESFDIYSCPVGAEDAWAEETVKHYARTNVAHATAQLQAEIDALRTRLEDTVRDSTNKIEALRAEVERVNSWNERVSVCRDHVADIVDGLCVICSLHAAEERADNLQAEVAELRAARIAYASEFPATKDGGPDTGNIHANIRSLKARTEQLAEALREAYRQVRELCVCYCHAYPEESFARYEALLRGQEEGGGYWPEMPKNGGPDWTGFDG